MAKAFFTDSGHPRLDLVIKEVAAESQDRPGWRPRVSSLGRCPRSLVYAMRGYAKLPREANVPLLLADGHNHEDISCGWLEKGGFQVEHRQHAVDLETVASPKIDLLECESCGQWISSNMIHGHIDGIIGNRFLFEHKGLGENGYGRLKWQCPEDYVRQCCCYILGLSRMGAFQLEGALLLIKSKNTSDYTQLWITYDENSDTAIVENDSAENTWVVRDVVSQVVDLFSEVEQYRVGQSFPDRPYAYSDWQCKWCEYRPVCWEGVDLSTTHGVLLEEDDSLCMAGRVLHEESDSKKEADRELKNIRAGVLEGMRQRRIESFTDGQLVVRMKKVARGKSSYDTIETSVI